MVTETKSVNMGHEQAVAEIDPAVLEQILLPDAVLAAQVLDRSITEVADAADADPAYLRLLKFQRQLVDMDDHRVAVKAAKAFSAAEGGLYTNVGGRELGGDRRASSLSPELVRDAVIWNAANAERWRIAGVDPHMFGDGQTGLVKRRAVERIWRDAAESQAMLRDVQARADEARETAASIVASIA